MDTRNRRAILVMVAAVALFASMDAGLKWLSPHYPPLQVTALRALASLPLVFGYVIWRRHQARLFQVRWSLQLLRGVLSIAMLGAFVLGLRSLPMATAYTLFFVAPLLITAASALILRERVGIARWLAIATGLAGVLIVLRPDGHGLSTTGALAVLLSAVCYAASAILIRIIGRTDSTESLMFWFMMLLTLGALAFSLPHWVPVRSQDYAAILFIGVSGFLGQLAITHAFRHGEASVLAPFEYIALAWGVALDWLIWRLTPDGLVYLGAAVIIASGVYLVRHERVHSEADHP